MPSRTWGPPESAKWVGLQMGCLSSGDLNEERYKPSTKNISRGEGGLFEKDDVQKRTVNLKSAVVVNETQLPELVHEGVDPRTSCADHLC